MTFTITLFVSACNLIPVNYIYIKLLIDFSCSRTCRLLKRLHSKDCLFPTYFINVFIELRNSRICTLISVGTLLFIRDFDVHHLLLAGA